MEPIIVFTGGEWFIQDGTTRLRSPTGELLPHQPQFIKTTAEAARAKIGSKKACPYKLKSGIALKEIGFEAVRPSKDEFAKKTPLYILMPQEDINPKTGNAIGEDKLLKDIGKVFADKMKQYIEGGGVVEVSRKKKGKELQHENEVD